MGGFERAPGSPDVRIAVGTTGSRNPFGFDFDPVHPHGPPNHNPWRKRHRVLETILMKLVPCCRNLDTYLVVPDYQGGLLFDSWPLFEVDTDQYVVGGVSADVSHRKDAASDEVCLPPNIVALVRLLSRALRDLIRLPSDSISLRRELVGTIRSRRGGSGDCMSARSLHKTDDADNESPESNSGGDDRNNQRGRAVSCQRLLAVEVSSAY